MIPTTWTMKLLRQRSMMTRYAKTLTMFIGLFSEIHDTRHKRAHLQPAAPRFRAICRTSICRSSTCPIFPETTWTGSRFCDCFKGAVIDNDQLTNSLRFQYLKSAVKGEASKMLTSITVTDDSFDFAMETLHNRYDNKRLILRAHIHGIVSYQPVSNGNTRELRKLVDTMEEHRHSLRNMGQPVEHQDPFFVYLIAEKLPTETRKFWGLSLKGKELQTYQELKIFLEERVQALESAAPSNSSSNTEKRSHSQQN